MKLHFWERIENRFRHSPPAAPATDDPSNPTIATHGSDRLRAWLSELGHDLVNLDRANIDRSDQDEPPRPHLGLALSARSRLEARRGPLPLMPSSGSGLFVSEARASAPPALR